MYKSGYKHPPVATRYKKGVSGNPNGRPKGSQQKTMAEIFEAILNKQIDIYENGNRLSLSTKEAYARKLINDAFKGKTEAMKIVLKMIEAVEREKEMDEVPGAIVVRIIDDIS